VADGFGGGCCSAAVLQVLEFVRQHTEYQQAQLAGNSVHIDRAFLQRYMPELAEHFHHRIIDVSTIKELCRCVRPACRQNLLLPQTVAGGWLLLHSVGSRHALCWFGCCELQHTCVDLGTLLPRRRWRVKLYRQAPRKVAAHTAMSDIKESLKELQYYKHVLFRGK
jgi:oligoribonuclease (3'-5' exoribonuclease)